MEIGSVWIDTRAKVPITLERMVNPEDVLRRIAEVVDVHWDGSVSVAGRWQRETDNGWETVYKRESTRDRSNFGPGRQYQQLNEDE